MTTALLTALSLSLEFERAKLVSPASIHPQLELRYMSRLRTRFPVVTISDLGRHNPKIAELYPDSVPKELAPYVPFDPLTLTTLQQAALLMMRESAARRSVVAKLLEDAQDKPTLPDFIALRDINLAEWGAAPRWRCGDRTDGMWRACAVSRQSMRR